MALGIIKGLEIVAEFRLLDGVLIVMTNTSKCAAIIGPYLSGKTSLMESLLFQTGATTRKGTIKEGNTVGDSAPEAKSRTMSIEMSIANIAEKGLTLLDCPGSIELFNETRNATTIADLAVVVAESQPDKAVTLAPGLKQLVDCGCPHIIFINKADTLADRKSVV